MEYVVKKKDAEVDAFTTVSGPHDSLERAHARFHRTMENVGVAEDMGVLRFRSVRGNEYVLAGVEEPEQQDEPIDPTKEPIL